MNVTSNNFLFFISLTLFYCFNYHNYYFMFKFQTCSDGNVEFRRYVNAFIIMQNKRSKLQGRGYYLNHSRCCIYSMQSKHFLKAIRLEEVP